MSVFVFVDILFAAEETNCRAECVCYFIVSAVPPKLQPKQNKPHTHTDTKGMSSMFLSDFSTTTAAVAAVTTTTTTTAATTATTTTTTTTREKRERNCYMRGQV